MPELFFQSIFSVSTVSASSFMACLGIALAAGLILVHTYARQSNCSKGFAVAVSLLPAVVCVVIMMVNGNVGAGVAIAGAFSLVRFRSVPGTAKEICIIFTAMAAGLMAGMGYLALTLIFSFVLSVAYLLFSKLTFGIQNRSALNKCLRITIPEDLDYSGVFDEIFADYASTWELTQVKTSNMGSLFRLCYHLTLFNANTEKELIDKLRCRNGNLEIVISSQETDATEL